jgi:hypothetical protein
MQRLHGKVISVSSARCGRVDGICGMLRKIVLLTAGFGFIAWSLAGALALS